MDFEEPWNRKIDLSAKSDVWYKRMLRHIDQAKNPDLRGTVADSDPFYNNHYMMMWSHVLGFENSGIMGKGTLIGHDRMISWCFYPDSVQEIMGNLEEEGTPFALWALDMMKWNSK